MRPSQDNSALLKRNLCKWNEDFWLQEKIRRFFWLYSFKPRVDLRDYLKTVILININVASWLKKREGRKARECRGCWYCVPRCMECAVCLGPDTEVEEAACGGDVVCLACCQALPKCRFCNKPYCTSHSSLRQGNTTTDAAMFACQACDYRTGASASDPIVLD